MPGGIRRVIESGGARLGTDEDTLDLRVAARAERLQAIRRALERLPLPPHLIDDAKLLTTELVANSIRHARLGPDDRIRITAHWSGTKLRVTVRDRRARTGAAVAVGSIRPAPGAESGWGLYLVDELATCWGTNLDGTPCFWFEMELAGQGDG
jgi:anti-sigma regulatory factor (Ser/Thr protein kinase)